MMRDPEPAGAAFERDRLSDAVVHDLNNLLAGIHGCADQVATALPGGHPALRDLDDIGNAVGEASLLVRLSSPRSWTGRPIVADAPLAEIVQVTTRLAWRLVPKSWRLREAGTETDAFVYADSVLAVRVLLGLIDWLASLSEETRQLTIARTTSGDAHAGVELTLTGGDPVSGDPPERLLELAAACGRLEAAGDGRTWSLALPISGGEGGCAGSDRVGPDRILLVEPDGLLGSFLATGLGADRAEVAHDLASALRKLERASGPYRLAVVSAELEEDGALTLLRAVRALEGDAGIVLLTCRDELDGELHYVEQKDARVRVVRKPFGMQKLRAAIDELESARTEGDDGPPAMEMTE